MFNCPEGNRYRWMTVLGYCSFVIFNPQSDYFIVNIQGIQVKYPQGISDIDVGHF